MILYFSIGIVFYSYMAIRNRHLFKDADFWGVSAGLFLGIVLWPAGMIYVFMESDL